MQKKHLIYILSLAYLTLGFTSTARAIISNTADSTAPDAQDLPRASLPEAPTIIVAIILLVLPFALCAFKSLTKSRGKLDPSESNS
jgi:hypothetical protein